MAPLTEMAEVPVREPAEVTRVPPETRVVPPKEFAPESVRVPMPDLTRLPNAPEMAEELVPAEIVSVVGPRTTVPPLKVAIEEVAPLRLSVPAETVPRVATPVTVVVPPEISEASVPTTVTVPAEIPPLVMTALLPKRVEPAPEREARVRVPVAPVKFRLVAVVLSFVTAASERPVPEIIAVEVLPTARVEAAL